MGKIKEVHKKVKSKVAKTIRPNFWRKVIRSLNPPNYADLSEIRIRRGASYVMGVLLAAFIIMVIISLPKITAMPGYIESELSKFDKLNISIDIEMSAPISFTSEDPQIIIDTENNRTEMGSEKLLITDKYIYYRPYGRTKEQNISELEDLTAKKVEISRLITLLIVILMPTILIILYIMSLIKYAITIAVVALLLYIVLRIAKKNLGIRKSINTAIYASTPMILIEVIFIPFNSKYLVQMFQFMGMGFYLVTLLIYILFAFSCAYFALKNPKEKKREEYPTVEKVEWDF
jgi:hypothetical protein